METKVPLKDEVIDTLLEKVIIFEKEIVSDKRLNTDSNLRRLKEIIEEEVDIHVD